LTAALVDVIASKPGPERDHCFLKLKQVLEIYTDVTRYPRPVRPDAAILVAAADDAYVSPESVLQLQQYWPGSELRLVPGGHVSAFILHQEHFRQAMRDALHRLRTKPAAAAAAAGTS